MSDIRNIHATVEPLAAYLRPTSFIQCGAFSDLPNWMACPCIQSGAGSIS